MEASLPWHGSRQEGGPTRAWEPEGRKEDCPTGKGSLMEASLPWHGSRQEGGPTRAWEQEGRKEGGPTGEWGTWTEASRPCMGTGQEAARPGNGSRKAGKFLEKERRKADLGTGPEGRMPDNGMGTRRKSPRPGLGSLKARRKKAGKKAVLPGNGGLGGGRPNRARREKGRRGHGAAPRLCLKA
jgi:hypothetical protein